MKENVKPMKILVVNCGSSSLKYQLIDMDNESVIAKGLCERIGIEGSKLTHQPAGKDNFVVENPMPDHKVAIQMVMDALQNPNHGVISSVDEISAIGHRVLHGGTTYSESIVVDEDVKRVIRECFDLGPLHLSLIHIYYENEQHTLKAEVESIRSQIAEQDSKVVNINSFVELARKYTSFEKLTPGMLHELVEKIIVHEGDKSSGHRIQKIEIYYSFVGDLESSHVVAQRTRKTPAA